MRSHIRLVIAAGALALATPALAEGTAGTHSRISAFGGDPLPVGQSMLHLQFGWPGLSATFLYGAGPKITAGGRLSLNYGFEGLLGAVVLGVKAQAVFRLGLMDTGKFNVGLDLSPGLFTYFASGGGQVQFGITVPAAFVFGIPLNEALSVHVALEMPMTATFTWYSSFYIPILFGGGLEFALDKSLMITAALRMGPLIDSRAGNAYFGLNALFGIAFKL